MHLTRKQATTKLPIKRKGTKYLARARNNINESVPIVIAIRDILFLAKTAKEVKKMIQQRILKINGKPANDLRDSIRLFNILEADKTYFLTYSPSKKFIFNEVKKDSLRLTKVVNIHLVKGGKIQINLHDGTNLLTKDKITVGDSLYLDEKNTVKKRISLEKGKEILAIKGKYLGQHGRIESVKEDKCLVHFKEGSALLNKVSLIAL